MRDLAQTEVLSRQCACFVNDVDQNCGAECRQALTGDRMACQKLNPCFAGGLECIWVCCFKFFVGGRIKNDRFDFFGAHDGTGATATSGASGALVGISELDGGCFTDSFASGSDEGGYHFVDWIGDVGTIANVNNATTTITMDDNYTITANFSFS